MLTLNKAISFFLVVILSLPAFSAGSQTGIRQTGFIYCVNGNVNTFNPQLAGSGLVVDTLAVQIYNRLLGINPYTYQLIPELADKWEVRDQGTTYIFHLRRHISFQTTSWFKPERQLNADDVIFSFLRIFDNTHPYHQVNGGNYPYFDSLQLANTIKSIRKLDDYRVEFRLNQPDASFLWHLATYYAPILSAEYADSLLKAGNPERIDQQPVGTGPYFLRKYQANQFVHLNRHDDYWRDKPHMAQVIVDLGSGGTGRISKLLTGECDILAYPAASQLKIIRHDHRLRLTQRSGMNLAYLAFNTQKPPLNNLKVRQAISLAIDYQRLIQFIYYGSAEIASSLLPRASWAYDKTIRTTEYNLEKARALLHELGIKELNLQLWVPTDSQVYNPSPLKMAELLQNDLANIGINLTIIPVEGPARTKRLQAMDHDLVLTGWETNSNDPDSFLRPLLSCAAVASKTNYANWCYPEFDQRLDNALLTSSLMVREIHYRYAQKLLAQHLPVLPLASSLRLQASRYDIRGLIISSFSNPSFADIYRYSPPLGNTP